MLWYFADKIELTCQPCHLEKVRLIVAAPAGKNFHRYRPSLLQALDTADEKQIIFYQGLFSLDGLVSSALESKPVALQAVVISGEVNIPEYGIPLFLEDLKDLNLKPFLVFVDLHPLHAADFKTRYEGLGGQAVDLPFASLSGLMDHLPQSASVAA